MFLKKIKFEVRSLWKPLHMQEYFKKYEKFKITKANSYFDRTISIPSKKKL